MATKKQGQKLKLTVGKAITITKSFTINEEEIELTFNVLPPTKTMADKIARARKDEETFEQALEDVFRPQAIYPLLKSWDGLVDEKGNDLELSLENLEAVCEAYPTVHGGIVEALWDAVPRKMEQDRGNSKTSSAGNSTAEEGQTTVEEPAGRGNVVGRRLN